MNIKKQPTRAIIMADGKGTRWKGSFLVRTKIIFRKFISKISKIFKNNPLFWIKEIKETISRKVNDVFKKSIPKNKHLLEINGESLLKRQIRLLKKNGVHDIYITSHNKLYNFKGAKRYEPKNNKYEIDRFFASKNLWNKQGDTLYIYGDVFYTEEAMKIICLTPVNNNYLFFGRYGKNKLTNKNHGEIFAFKFSEKTHTKTKNKLLYVREEFKKGNITRCRGWEFYRAMQNISLKKHQIIKNFIKINDLTDDFDTKEEFEVWYNFYKKNKK